MESFLLILNIAIVQPLIIKPNLDKSDINCFCSIFQLPFLSKILEKVVSAQLLSNLNDNNMFEKFQSGFRTCHGSETALLRFCNDLVMSLDSGKCAILILLDLGAAFDTVDHCNSFKSSQVGIQGTALKWFKSYLTGRSLSITSLV